MQRWNEKPEVAPAINVNLKPCSHTCPVWRIASPPQRTHAHDCPGVPVLIPCPIPRSVVFTVMLGKCSCPWANTSFSITGPHHDGCPARPLRVACSIGGKTWEDTFIDDLEPHHSNPGLPIIDVGPNSTTMAAALDRWTLIKALVLDMSPAEHPLCTTALLSQRTDVFAALADMTRAEDNAVSAQARLDAVLTPGWHSRHLADDACRAMGLERPSRMGLLAYVEHLIEQVGSLP